MKNKLISIHDPYSDSCPDIGGKAQNLAALSAAGFPTPEGWVVSSDAFEDHLERHNLADRAMSAAQACDEERLWEIRSLIASRDIDDRLRDALSELIDAPMAVRSSAAVEDQASASYSGLFETVLGVQGTTALANAVKRVWASVFRPLVLAYHREMNVETIYPAMSVLIVPMAPAEAAGVAFSADPSDGNPLVIAISAARGLGTTVVNGTEECDQYWIDWESLSVLKTRRGTQKTGEFLTSNGHCVRRSLLVEHASQPVLDEHCLRRVAELTRQIDRLWNKRVDMEFAVVEGDVLVLQARPITGLPPYFPDNPEEADPKVHRSGDHWPRPVCPFVRARVGVPSSPPIPSPPWPLEVEDLFVRHGRLFFREALAPEYEERPDAPWEDRTFLRRMWRMADPAEDFRTWREWTTYAYLEIIPSLRSESKRLLCLSRRRFAELGKRELRELLCEAISVESGAAYFYLAASGCTYESLRRLEVLAKDWLGRADSSQATQLALTMMQGQQKLSHLLEQDIEAAANGTLSPEQLACEWGYSYLELEDMMDFSRWRGWREDDTPVRIAIAIQRKARNEAGIGARLHVSRDQSESCFQAALRTLRASDPTDGERRALVFAACVEACRNCFSLKDDRDLVLSHAQAALRWCLLETGRRLRSDGVVHEEEDIFLLEPQEILQWLSDLDAAADAISRLVNNRVREQERLARYTLPPVDRAAGTPIPSDAEVLRGEPASPGVAVGPARVVETIEDVKRLRRGDVLCLKGEKRVGWTTFFPSISALVYETGNWLSHESNLCRELGIPAVVCVGEGINVIRPGEELRVDGLEGTITRMAKQE